MKSNFILPNEHQSRANIFLQRHDNPIQSQLKQIIKLNPKLTQFQRIK